MGDLPGTLGPFELLERLGAGGMAETFVALRRGPAGFEQRVCVKRILPAYVRDEEFVRLFLDEARIAARLRHANVVQVLDFGEVDGAYFLALELVDGTDLRGLLRHLAARGENLTSGLVVHVALALAAALDHAHRPDPVAQRGAVIHRDLSPANVLLSTAGEVKLADFGIAKAVERTRVTRTGVSRGKVPYMAPEYALEGRCDARTDLFALGVTLYECLTGRRPYDGATDVDTLRRASSGEREPLRRLLPHTPAALAEAVERLLSPDPDARYASAAELQDALVPDAPPPTASRILGELVRRAQASAASSARGAPAAAPRRAPSHRAPAEAAADAVTRTASAAASSPPEVEPRTDGTTRPQAARAPLAAPAARARAVPLPVWLGLGAFLALGGMIAAGAAFAAFLRPRLADANAAPPTAGSGTPAPPAGAATRTPAAAGAAVAAPAAAAPAAPASPAAARPSPEPPAARAPIGAPEPGPERPRGAGEGHRAGREEALDEAPEPGATARLRIDVVPYGEVWVDGRKAGRAPVEVRLRPGRHRVEVDKDGLRSRHHVELAPGEARTVRY